MGKMQVLAGKANVNEYLHHCSRQSLDFHKDLNPIGSWKWRLPHRAEEGAQPMDSEWTTGMYRCCRACGEAGHLSRDTDQCTKNLKKGMMEDRCAECAGDHLLRACPRLGYVNLVSTVDVAKLAGWVSVMKNAGRTMDEDQDRANNVVEMMGR